MVASGGSSANEELQVADGAKAVGTQARLDHSWSTCSTGFSIDLHIHLHMNLQTPKYEALLIRTPKTKLLKQPYVYIYIHVYYTHVYIYVYKYANLAPRPTLTCKSKR